MTTRSELRRQGEAMRQKLFGAQAARTNANQLAPGFGDFLDETEFGIVWCRPGLALEERMLCTLAALASTGRLDVLGRYVGAALHIGVTPVAIQETVIQIGIYAGFAASQEALACAGTVFAERGVKAPPPAPRDDALDTLMTRGKELMNALHREGSSQGYAAPGNPVTGALYPVAIQYGYGEIWFRPGLTHLQRVLISVASFTALKLESQIKKFGQAALNMGATREQVIEAVIQTAPYSGFAPALNALGLLSEVVKPV
jgi:4-carboxymuconolactone decarboxylase